MLHRVSVVVVVLFFSVFSLAAKQRAFVVDADGKAIATVDLTDGSVAAKVQLPFTPDRARLAPDGQTLLVLDQGEGTMGFWVAEFRPKTKSNMAIVRDGKLIATSELGWGLAESAFSKDGQSAFVLTTGYESNKEPERKLSELVRISLSDGKVTGRIPLDAAAEGFATDEASSVGIIYSPPYPKKKPTPLPARLTFVDLASFQPKETIEIRGADVRRPVSVGDLLYVPDAGSKSTPGSVTVISTKSKSVVKKIDVGPEALISGSDKDNRIYVLSQGSSKDSGALRIIKGTDVVAEYKVAAAPRLARLSDDGKRVYVLGWKEFSVVDLAGNTATAAVEQARNPFAVLGTADGRRAFTINMDGDQCCRLTAFDLGGMKRLTTFLGGSKGERFGEALAAAALTVASYQAGRSAAMSSGSNTFYYSMYAPRSRGAARGPLTFGPGEKKVYFVDTQTSDVTIADVETGERLRNLDAGSGLQEVVPLHDAGLIAGIANSQITLIDVNTDEVRSTIKLEGGVTDAVLTEDGKHLIVFGKKSVVVLDAMTAKELARTKTLEQPVQVVFAR